jgi:NAD(P)-dependent dehydrogenase (short-subunit alcohol dehydrogenase family)
MGLATAAILLDDGASGVALLDFNDTLLARAQADLSAEHPKARIQTFNVDVRESTQVEDAVKTTFLQFGRLDGCVNAAGVAPGPPNKVADLEDEGISAAPTGAS